MSAHHLLLEAERLTVAMLEAARREDWAKVAAVESVRQPLIASLRDPISASANANLQISGVLNRIAESNIEITRLVQNRREDIGLLLQAFGDASLKAD